MKRVPHRLAVAALLLPLAELSRREPEHFVLIDKATVILPGTHSKHVELAGGELRAFRTFMTGELYALLINSTFVARCPRARAEGTR